MKPNGGGDKIPGKLKAKIDSDLGGVAKMKEDFTQAGVTQFGSGWAWLAVKDGKLDRQQDAERRKPARARRNADPRLRRLGALLLHRLPQPAAGLSQGISRSPGELGARRRNVRRREQIDHRQTTSTLSLRHYPARRSAIIVADRLAVVVLAVSSVVALADVPRLRPRLGRLHPFAIRRSAARALRLGLCRPARAVLRQSLQIWRRLRHGGGARRQDACRSVCSKRGGWSAPAVGIIGLIATWRIGRRLGGPIAGLIALVLLATCPLYYGHMFINAKDAPFAAAMAVLLLGMVRAFEEYPRPSARDSRTRQASVLGLVFGSRILAGIAAPCALAALLLIADR